MGPGEIIEVLEALKAQGAVYFKSRDFEVRFRRKKPLPQHAAKHAKPPRSQRIAPPPPAAEQAELPLNVENTRRAEGLVKTLKLDPESLINTIFPDGAE